ncbi:MAG: hypothetical protein AB7Q17_00275 [Phycisphaerae bacterium]
MAPEAWLVLATDGLLAAAVVASAAGWGAAAPRWLGLPRAAPLRRRCLAVVLGFGWLATATLALGCAGWLGFESGWALVALGCALGVVTLTRTARHDAAPSAESPRGATPPPAPRTAKPAFPRSAPESARAFALVGAAALGVIAAIAFAGATLPPGILWEGEARGYDALEYHLQAPREYYDAGRIHFLSHNVYASFPQQMEMLYLLLMHLAGGSLAAAVPAQLVHASCGVLLVCALAAWAQPGRARLVAVLVGGATPWIGYLACLAYVELGMLLAATVAGGIVFDAARSGRVTWGALLAAGLAAGIAGGCKYTALALVTAPLLIAVLVVTRGPVSRRACAATAFALGAAIAFAPWLARNVAFTGNPVYPFAYNWFGGAAWSDAQAEQWARAHRVAPKHSSVGGRLILAGGELLGRTAWPTANGASLFGAGLFAAAALGAALRRDRESLLLAVWAFTILGVWIGATHIPGRFALPVLVPLVWLASRAGEGRDAAAAPESGPPARTRAAGSTTIGLVLAVGAAIAGAATLAAEYTRHSHAFAERHGVPMSALAGQTAVLADAHELNQLPASARLWLVGDAAVFYIQRAMHYTVVFNRDPWIAFALASGDAAAALEWLRIRGVTHLVFSWAEIERLRRTYGFAAGVTEAWVRTLADAGLRRVVTSTAPSGRVLTELYEVGAR